MAENGKSDAQELGEVLDVLGGKGATGIGAVLDVVATKVPALLNALRSTLYSPQAGEEIGRGVGAFYKELVQAGIPEQEALGMAREYLGSLQDILRNSLSGAEKHGGSAE
jgi:hypothetical protein